MLLVGLIFMLLAISGAAAIYFMGQARDLYFNAEERYAFASRACFALAMFILLGLILAVAVK